MEYILTAILTLFLSLAIINIVSKREKRGIKRVLYRQSDAHAFMKNFFSKETENKPKNSQLKKRAKKNMVKVVITDDKAYWVLDNVFYMSNLIDGGPDPETTQPVDAVNIPKEDLDKLIFILDNINEDGDTNDDSSSGNK